MQKGFFSIILMLLVFIQVCNCKPSVLKTATKVVIGNKDNNNVTKVVIGNKDNNNITISQIQKEITQPLQSSLVSAEQTKSNIDVAEIKKDNNNIVNEHSSTNSENSKITPPKQKIDFDQISVESKDESPDEVIELVSNKVAQANNNSLVPAQLDKLNTFDKNISSKFETKEHTEVHVDSPPKENDKKTPVPAAKDKNNKPEIGEPKISNESNSQDDKSDLNNNKKDTKPEVVNIVAVVDDKNSHFFAYLLTMMFIVIFTYLVFHNKKRIIAMIIEGKNENNRRTRTRARYHKLDNNLEEAMNRNSEVY